MATINPTVTRTNKGFGTLIEVTWVGMTDADTLTPHDWESSSETATYQVYGTVGGATVNARVSNDGVAFTGILDVDGASVSGTAAVLKKVRKTGISVQPVVTGGTAESVSMSLAYWA